MSTLTDTEIQAMNEALDDEYRSWVTYDQVIADFGEVRPFSNIREAEARHIEALHALYLRYQVPIPENNWAGKVDRYSSLQAACEAGVADEIANGEMYERLLMSTDREDVCSVFRALGDASQHRHLPAFQRCAQGSGSNGCGDGKGRRNRGGRGRS
jgi:hypothetical protein